MLNPTKIIFTLSICLLSACQLNNANSENVQLKNLFKQNFTSESIAIVDISDDGRHLLAGSAVEKIRYWEVQNLNKPKVKHFDSELVALNFIGQNNNIFFANRTGSVRIFSNTLEKTLAEYRFPKPSRFSSVSNNGELIAYGEYIFLRPNNKLLQSTVGHAVQSSLQIGNDNYILSSGFHDERVVVRDKQGEIVSDWRLDEPVQTASISNDGKTVIASVENGDCYVWALNNKDPQHRCDRSSPANAIYISKSGKLFTLVSGESISAYHLEPFKKQFSKTIESYIRSSALTENNWLVIGLDNGNVQIWDVLTGDLLATQKITDDRITSIDVNVEHKLIAIGAYDGTLALYRFSE
jgi:WD40 repeat protein